MVKGARIGEQLRDVRRARGLTQQQLADMAGIARPTVNQIERDNLAVGPSRLAKLAAALDVSVLELAPAAEPDQPGLTLLDRLAALEALCEKDRRQHERALRAATRRLAELEAHLELLKHQSDPQPMEDSAT